MKNNKDISNEDENNHENNETYKNKDEFDKTSCKIH